MMASPEDGTAPASSTAPAKGEIKKLSPLPKGATMQKRPLTRRQVTASVKTAVIYVSSSMPFMSAVKRVQKQLLKFHRNATRAAPRYASLQARVESLKRDCDAGIPLDGTQVTLLGTGRAVEKTLAIASWFQQRGDCVVKMTTRTVGTVDDVVTVEGEDESRLRMLSCLEVVLRLK
ncbi:Ribonuclease P/MRP, subunit POP7 [Drechmeria coniospora]|uniref:Ribonuclease P/MRP, subunit POP7 n=1 Tax=Drechmeria coniospora TaxID=98403 RepID=A0A151GV33_DRECN|nr:Ribonuclease P/MRP, subunit POP7 [Drechmeria coniospora]KYK60948.1 Ribonuclease P/MRP, subunit POP7 [Drechmeria coniospora]ODA83634.1 hypothetical protein RJ55_02149 [Drechmeria coniospora]